MHNNNTQNKLATSKENNKYIKKKTTKMIKLYICNNRKMEITFRNCLIFKGKMNKV